MKERRDKSISLASILRTPIVLYEYLIVTPSWFSSTEVISWPLFCKIMILAPLGVTRLLAVVVAYALVNATAPKLQKGTFTLLEE